MTKFTDTFTQGGQTQLHKLRMINQVIGTTLKASLIIGMLCFSFLLWYDGSWQKLGFLIAFYKANLRNFLSFLPQGLWDTSWILHADGKYYEVHDHILIHKPSYILTFFAVQALLIKKLLQSLLSIFITMTLLSAFWIYRGKGLKKKEVLSGGEEISSVKLTKLLKKNKKDSCFTLSGLPIVRDSETKHILLVGTTGAGKTNALNDLLIQIRANNQKAIIVDTTGTFVEKFYDSKTDLILNPFDERSVGWDFWGECNTHLKIDDCAASIIPDWGQDKFWPEACRTLFAETIRILQRKKAFSLKALFEYALYKPLAKVQEFYAGTPAAPLVDMASDKTAASIRITLATHLRSMRTLVDCDQSFCIREWIRDDSKKGWLFLVALPDQRKTLNPLLTTWINIAINSLMSCSQNYERRVWFVLDEMPSLNEIEALPRALAEIRKYGGCIVSGLQNISQLDDIYGPKKRQTMTSLYNTKVFFRSPDIETAKWISSMIGEHEVLESSESISFGAHQMRDGVSLNEHKKHKAIVPYSELLNLKDLEAYIKLSEGYPVTKLAFEYNFLEARALPFIEKIIKNELEEQSPQEKIPPTERVNTKQPSLDLLKLKQS
ncbi:type IV conjugative transfer system coupling protein TraD [Candidatus Odyssella thessalonicensis]|uniref:type IV conjugative transfer system coupling protein TraD n=1 Tax=Candidatus Odyssella thessalonicensis TaxID=84647 RepID=UPI000225AF7F|nr:type IV conjugative transfer system coupling protein TraD [Candidatus Odyssella thessalonicensis]